MKMLSVCVFLLVLVAGAHAGINKCTGPDGKVTFSDGLCPSTSGSEKLRERANTLDSSGSRQQNQTSSNAASCQTLRGLADNTYASFLENTNPNRWGVAFRSLQSLVSSCATGDVCQLVKERVDHAQARYGESNTSYRGSQLNSVTTLYAQSCQGGTPRQNTQTSESVEGNANPKSHFWTKDQFGTTVRSDRCYWTKDAFGTSVRSAGCK